MYKEMFLDEVLIGVQLQSYSLLISKLSLPFSSVDWSVALFTPNGP